jgi:predicted metal-dependent RNase
MKIKLVGASGGEVTGSAYVIRTKRAVVLVDAGMFQGGRQSEAKNRLPAGVRPEDIGAVLLTHAHLDHTGRLPLLIKHGFRGPVYATRATIDLAEIILKDCARIQSQDAERKSRKVVQIFGERIPVQAKVHTLNGFSGHADQRELLKWFATIAPAKPKVIMTHGEDRGRSTLAKLIQQRFKLNPALPNQGDVIEI